MDLIATTGKPRSLCSLHKSIPPGKESSIINLSIEDIEPPHFLFATLSMNCAQRNSENSLKHANNNAVFFLKPKRLTPACIQVKERKAIEGYFDDLLNHSFC